MCSSPGITRQPLTRQTYLYTTMPCTPPYKPLRGPLAPLNRSRAIPHAFHPHGGITQTHVSTTYISLSKRLLYMCQIFFLTIICKHKQYREIFVFERKSCKITANSVDLTDIYVNINLTSNM